MKQSSRQDVKTSIMSTASNYLRMAMDQMREWNLNVRTRVLVPLQALLKVGFNQYPLLTSYLTVAIGLSIIPTLSFIGFSLFVGSILVGTALLYVIVCGSIMIGSAFFALLFTLASLFVFAAWIVIASCITMLSVKMIYGLQNSLAHRIKHSPIGKDIVDFSTEEKSRKPHESIKDEI